MSLLWRHGASLILTWIAFSTLPRVAASQTWQVTPLDKAPGQFEILLHGDRFATYSYADPKISRPFFANIVLPGGIQVTRNHPPQAGDRTDHANYHPGIWLAFGDLSGQDDWRLRAPVRHVRFVQRPEIDDQQLTFSTENAYLKGDTGDAVCHEIVKYTFVNHDDGVLLLWDSVFRSTRDDFYFGDQEEMGLGVRLATPIAVASQKGGRILNSLGGENEQGVWGQQAKWCDYAGPIGNQFAGVMIMPDPRNFRLSWYHARDYGFVTANPFGRKAFTKQEASRVVVDRNDAFRLGFGVYFHANPAATDFSPQEAYEDYLSRLR